MVIINSEPIDLADDYRIETFNFTFGEGVEVLNIDEPLLNTKTAAELFAKGTFLQLSYDRQTVIVSSYSRGLNINDVVAINAPSYNIPNDQSKNKFIIKQIVTRYVDNTAIDTITGVRYD